MILAESSVDVKIGRFSSPVVPSVVTRWNYFARKSCHQLRQMMILPKKAGPILLFFIFLATLDLNQVYISCKIIDYK